MEWNNYTLITISARWIIIVTSSICIVISSTHSVSFGFLAQPKCWKGMNNFSSSRKPRPPVWPEQRLETTRLRLLQAEGRHHEDLGWGQARLRDGGWRLGVHPVHARGAVCHRRPGPHPPRRLDWFIYAGRETEGLRPTAPSNPWTPRCIKMSLICSSSRLRNATRFPVRSNKEIQSSAGLMQRR